MADASLFDVGVVRVWGTCRGSSPGGAEPHQLRGLMSGGRPPVGSRCGISGVLAEPNEGRTIWAKAKGWTGPCILGRTKAEVRMAGLAEPRGSAMYRMGLACLGSLVANPRFGLVRRGVGRTKEWFGRGCAHRAGWSGGLCVFRPNLVRRVGATSSLQVAEDGARLVRGWS